VSSEAQAAAQEAEDFLAQVEAELRVLSRQVDAFLKRLREMPLPLREGARTSASRKRLWRLSQGLKWLLSPDDEEAPAFPYPLRSLQALENQNVRLARELREGIAHLLANAVLELESSISLLAKEPEAVEKGLHLLREELEEGLADIRWFIFELHPPLLADLGLAVSLNSYVEEYGKRFGLSISARLKGLPERLPATMEMAIFRILQGALHIAHRHAEATHIDLRFERKPGLLVFTVEDDGRRIATQCTDEESSWELLEMWDRAEFLQGELHILSRPEGGNKIVLTVPYPLSLGGEGHEED